MSITKIACCTDFSDNGRVAVDMAIELAEKYDSQLHVIHVLPPTLNPFGTDIEVPDFDSINLEMMEENRKTLVAKVEEQMEQNIGERIADRVDCEFVVLNGHVSTEILSYIDEQKIDLVVVGAYGLSGMGLVIFGSVAKRIAHRATCSVMIARKTE